MGKREPFVIEVGGCRLVAAPVDQDLSVEQDGWITAKLERAGVADPRLDELTPGDRKKEIRLRILESGQIASIMAGFLVAEGEPWETAAAEKHAGLLRAASRADRATLFMMLDIYVNAFFGSGRGSASPTGKPSPAATPAPIPENLAASALDTGNLSSAPSPVTTPMPSAVSFDGPAETPLALSSST